MDTKVLKTSNRRWSIAGLIFSSLSLLLQGIGYASPGWIIIVISMEVIGNVLGSGVTGFGEVTTAVSIWYGRVCTDGDYQTTPSCVTQTGHDARFYGFRISTALEPLSEIGWIRIKLWLTAALYTGLIGTFLSALSQIRGLKISPKLWLPWAAICMLVSGAFVVPAIVEIVLATLYADEAIDKQTGIIGHRLVRFETPWAMIVAGVSVIMAMVSALCLCVAACKSRTVKSRGYDEDFYDIGAVDSNEHSRL